MTSDRWEEINRLYNASVEVEEKERASFLKKACEGDQELRREVESLLAYDQQAQQLLDRPAMQMAAEKLASESASLLGKKLGPYQVQVLLGSGGMGEVYRARDSRLNRIVAIKVLPRHLLERSDLRQRFEREARAIASLDHPHICALYDIGHEGATDFLVMQYLDGETLSQRLKKGPLPTAEVVRYAIEIAGALEQAHRKGVVHRDLKPGNIMLTETGAKLLDFGLANTPPVSRCHNRSVHRFHLTDRSSPLVSRYDPERQAADIWLVGSNGESPRRIRVASGQQRYYVQIWSANGQRLFYRKDDQGRAIESCDLRGERVTKLFSSKDRFFWTFCWVPEGRILFPLYESKPGLSLTADFWEIKVDAATGTPLSEAWRLAQWPTFGSAQIGQLSTTADGKQLGTVGPQPCGSAALQSLVQASNTQRSKLEEQQLWA